MYIIDWWGCILSRYKKAPVKGFRFVISILVFIPLLVIYMFHRDVVYK